MTCYSWMSGCNIIDMNDYLDNYGVEIYAKDRLEMSPSGSGGTTNGAGDTFEESSSSSSTAEWPEADTDNQPSGVSPSLSLGVWTPQPAPIERTPPPRWTAAPVEPNPSMSPAGPPADGHYPEHHVFCGESWIGVRVFAFCVTNDSFPYKLVCICFDRLRQIVPRRRFAQMVQLHMYVKARMNIVGLVLQLVMLAIGYWQKRHLRPY